MIRRLLSRLKRKLLKKDYWKDPSFPSYWFGKELGGREAQVVQVGSNDGKQGDPLHFLLKTHHAWKALFVEPVPYSFQQLQENYGSESRFTYEQSAINQGEEMTFYYVDKKAENDLPDLPFWYDQLASFDRNHITKHLDGVLEPYIIEEKLNGLTLLALFQKHTISEIDILHIDTEGYDWKILSQLDLDTLQPKFILFEQQHLSPAEKTESIEFLSPYYRLYEQGLDILGVKKEGATSLIMKLDKHMKSIK